MREGGLGERREGGLGEGGREGGREGGKKGGRRKRRVELVLWASPLGGEGLAGWIPSRCPHRMKSGS